jgi:hypothetical protein
MCLATMSIPKGEKKECGDKEIKTGKRERGKKNIKINQIKIRQYFYFFVI